MQTIIDDTNQVREEFNGIATSTKIFIASLIAIAILLGAVAGAAFGYGIAVEEVDGRDCIDYEDTLYCAD